MTLKQTSGIVSIRLWICTTKAVFIKKIHVPFSVLKELKSWLFIFEGTKPLLQVHFIPPSVSAAQVEEKDRNGQIQSILGKLQDILEKYKLIRSQRLCHAKTDFKQNK